MLFGFIASLFGVTPLESMLLTYQGWIALGRKSRRARGIVSRARKITSRRRRRPGAGKFRRGLAKRYSQRPEVAVADLKTLGKTMKSIRRTSFFAVVALTLLLAREPQAAGPSPITVTTSATSRDYLWTLIACGEKDEATISDAFNAFITLLATGELKKEELRFPAHLAT